jgi:hypothetical protein
MKFLTGAIALAMGLLAPAVMAAPQIPEPNPIPKDYPGKTSADLVHRDLEPRGPGSCHTTSNRACWSPGFDINTDYEVNVPPAGTTRHCE